MAERNTNDWFLQEWCALKGVNQADIRRKTGWSLGKTHSIYHGESPYKRETVNALAEILGIKPHELLQHPEDVQWWREFTDMLVDRGLMSPRDGLKGDDDNGSEQRG